MGVATSTLRYYERRGLVTADARVSGQRRYRWSTVRRLEFVQMLQDAGLSLDEIQGVLAADDNASWKAIARRRLDQLDADLRQEQTELAREQLDLANLRSPERIAAEAAADGMVPATTVHWMSAASGDETVVLRDGSGEADEATPEATTDDPA
ncbi:MAG: MerR family transcriptional regulator, partial [Acidimicrobiales bacterium]|nr:MerR family transcriptional regulator [Acidimicrobiales bacterium]